ncbi:MAG: shikimate dehydrogenase [Gemmatimonadota bacterium]|nr:MAG: shikimate dehydrogenase [Gemmatimonadota bacterium]
MNRISGTSRPFAVIGDPIAHSLSPAMYNAAFAALGIDAVYVALRTDTSALPHTLRAFESLGIAGNVTIPHKVAVARLLIRVTPLAKELEAVNTFWPEGERLVGDNTDVRGIVDALEQLGSEGPWIVSGTGGAARAVAAAAREKDVTLLVRSRGRRRAADFADWAQAIGVDCRPDDGSVVATAVNATPLGLRASEVPFGDRPLDGCRVALDLVYGRGGTGWVKACRKRGMQAADGRSMLVAQGAQAFRRFYPEVLPPIEVMAAAVERELSR